MMQADGQVQSGKGLETTSGIFIRAEQSTDYVIGLVQELSKLPKETEWAEFKHNYAEPQDIGEYISALSNSAALVGKASAYLIWGLNDNDHAVVGTQFSPRTTKVGNEELENWLLRALAPRIHFSFFEIQVDGLPVVLLEIERAYRQPVQFQGNEFIRVGSYKKRLKDFPEKERAIWRLFDRAPFESGVAAERISDEEVLALLDYPAYFDLLKPSRNISLGRAMLAVLKGLLNISMACCLPMS